MQVFNCQTTKYEANSDLSIQIKKIQMRNKFAAQSRIQFVSSSKQELLQIQQSTMGKGKTKATKNKTRSLNKNQLPENDEDVNNPQAWGSSKRNYYQEDDQEYSSVSEQQQQAQKIYEKQHQLLNNAEYYMGRDIEKSALPQEESDSNVIEQTGVSEEYLLQEIKYALQCQQFHTKLNKQSVGESLYNLYKKLVDMYLLIAISLKEFKISYAEHHPMLEELLNVKNYLEKVRRKAQKLHKNYKPSNSSKYEELRRKQLVEKLEQRGNIEKKQKRQQIQNQTQQNVRKKQAFATIKDNEARLANETILKNKGLMKKRKKIEGNSRVKLRKKYQKAQSKQRALGHFIRENPGRVYEGETNIKYGKIASTKFKT